MAGGTACLAAGTAASPWILIRGRLASQDRVGLGHTGGGNLPARFARCDAIYYNQPIEALDCLATRKWSRSGGAV